MGVDVKTIKIFKKNLSKKVWGQVTKPEFEI
jgi:hypothetical protein